MLWQLMEVKRSSRLAHVEAARAVEEFEVRTTTRLEGYRRYILDWKDAGTV